MLGYIVLVLIGLMVAFAVYVRLAPSVPAAWHVDPAAATDPGAKGVLLIPDAAGGGAPVYDLPMEDIMAAFDRFAMAQPRVTRLVGSVAEGRITYIARSRLWGFPDYITVEALPLGADRSTLAILSRLRFGGSDTGVNARRMAAWLAAFDPTP